MSELGALRRNQLLESVTEVVFSVLREGQRVPAIGWFPAGCDRPPVVLLGHGGSGHKAIERHRRLATRLAADRGIACLAIDGPYHGERAVPGDGRLGYQHRVVTEGPAAVHEGMRQDWLRVLADAADAGMVDSDAVGFLGLSMGARYGLGVCAALGSRLRGAVIGKFGLLADDPMMVAMAADHVIRASAAAITAPVLQHVQWDDEVFARHGQLQLFGLFASPEKQLRARPGLHAHTRDDDETAWSEHLSGLLRPSV